MTQTLDTQTIVISLGGSLVVPDEIDIKFLCAFKQVIEEQILAYNRKFVIVVGGGRVCRRYQQSARDLGVLNEEDADWIGVHTTRLNAHLMRTIFKKYAHPRLFSSKQDVLPFDEHIAIGAGWKPGWSTDFVAVSIAEIIGARAVANLSNTKYVFDADPAKNKDAKPIFIINWANYRSLIPSVWSPGLNTPFDPVASKKAQELLLEVSIMNGADMENFKNYLNGCKFEGTTITP
jgi:uridylate kinase